MRGVGTVNVWCTDGSAHPFQLKDCLYVPDLMYSVVGEDPLYANGFRRNTTFGETRIPFIECIDNQIPFRVLTQRWGSLHVIPYWVFHPYKRTDVNWREMRNNTRTESARHYLPFVIRHNKFLPESASFGTDYIRNGNKLRLIRMTNSLVQTTPSEPLYLREISPELPVQRTSYKDSRAVQHRL